MRLRDVQQRAEDHVFRYSLLRASLLLAVAVAIVTALLRYGAQANSLVPGAIALLILLGLLLFRRLFLARLRGSNWLVRANDAGIYVHFRSYANYHFPEDDLTVAFIPYAEIRSARIVRETSRVMSDDGPTTYRRRLVELQLGVDGDELAAALAAEIARPAPRVQHWYGTSSSVVRHYPVRMAAPDRVQIEWEVVPAARSLLGLLPRASAPATASLDFTALAALPREAQDARLRELIA
ncbi:MAG TPA: hypothetical protein VFB32_09490, partial [Rudaea sp.]|nr:hypothetical protein [Rudaea sp.]